MRHFSKLMLILSSSIISFTSCYESALDKPAEKLSANKVHAQMYVSLNYDDAVFAGDANVSNRRFIVEARDAENTENVLERKEIVYNTASTVTEGFERIPVVFELDQKKYVVSVWMDYIETGTDKDFYYNTEDLSKISMITPESAADVHRDALASTQTIDLTEQALGTEFAVNAQLLSRVAKWSLIANDWRNLLAKKEEAAKTAIINVAYTSGIAKGFNLYTASTGDIKEGIAFEAPINVPVSEENTKITLAEDYFFISQNEETVGLNVIVKSATGEVWHKTENVSLTCNAGKESKSESNYLTGEDEIIKDPAKFEGEGTAESPYLIYDAEDLKTLMELINNGENQDYPYQTSYYEQKDDIDVSSITGGISIGNDKYPFKGIFDGKGYKIEKATLGIAKTQAFGLFGVIDGANLKNIRIVQYQYTTDYSGKPAYGGGICGLSKGTSTIESCWADIINNHTFIGTTTGGICGKVESGSSLTIKASKVGNGGNQIKAGNAKTDKQCFVGGMIGHAAGNIIIEDSYVHVQKVTNVMNAFNVTKNNLDYIGGICGKSDGNVNITRCYINGDVFLESDKNPYAPTYAVAGSIVAKKLDSGISDCYYISPGTNFKFSNVKSIVGNGHCCDESGYALESENLKDNQPKGIERGYLNGAECFITVSTEGDKTVTANWPSWSTNDSSAWKGMGSYVDTDPGKTTGYQSTYPTLKWEN